MTSGSPHDSSPETRVRREAWVQELGEASVLPEEDPIRRAIEARVMERGGWSQAHWLALLEEGQAWRGLLQDIEPPEELRERLRPIPRQHGQATTHRFGRRTVVWGSAALVLLAVGAVGLLLSKREGSAGLEQSVREVALLALNDHLDTHDQDVLADNPEALVRGLASHIPFPVDLPDIGPGMTPVGGRLCTLGSHPVAFTAWQGAAGRLTLLQLRRRDFGLPADMDVRVVSPEMSAARGRPLDVLFFGRGDTVWVVVADHAEDLRRVRQAVATL